MGNRKTVLFYLAAVGWGLFVMVLTVYLFFPYQKALKIALQNTVGGGRTAVSMEGVAARPLGIKASRLLLKPDGSTGQVPFELSNVRIFLNPLSLLKGKFTIASSAAIYGGTLSCTVEGASVTGPSNPDISLTLDHVNMGKCPEGVLPWFKGISGVLNGVVRKQATAGRPDRQTGFFRFSLSGGEVKDLQVKNMPCLVIPYREIVLEGKIDGPRLNIGRLALKSDLVSLSGTGFMESGDDRTDRTIDIRLSYEALSQAFPLKGKGVIAITGSQAAPAVEVLPQSAGKPAQGPGRGQLPASGPQGGRG